MKITSATGALIVAFVAVMLLLPVPVETREGMALMNLAHAPLFAALAWIVLVAFRSKLPKLHWAACVIVWVLVTSFGAIMEVMQPSFGRYSSWHDLVANALGAAAGLAWVSARRTATYASCFLLIVFGLLVISVPIAIPVTILTDCYIQRRQMPRLASFESRLEAMRWTFQECRPYRSSAYASHGTWSLHLDLDAGTYPGATLVWPVRDWSEYRELRLDIYLATGPPLEMIVKVEDAMHNGETDDRFHHVARLVPGENSVCIALADVEAAPRGRRMDLTQITKLQLFTVRPTRPRAVYVDNIRLVP